ncbi:MAG: pyridoxal-phosphate dependent enzyme, partial [Rhodobacteraceae bacterium]|nr:pyridoxal-phosphate dependent enzyme [Paracoccaceae bacterium]
MNKHISIKDRLEPFPRAHLMTAETPVERLDRMSDLLGIDLWLKRDDLTGLGLGGNKTRQLEFYFGEALAKGADTVLITGAVQSNFVRSAAAAAARLGLKSVLQLEERVPDMGDIYYNSGNVLLSKILGAEHISYPLGEDEAGA